MTLNNLKEKTAQLLLSFFWLKNFNGHSICWLRRKLAFIFQCNVVMAALFSSPVIFKMGLIDGRNLTDTVPICGEFCDEIGWETAYGRRVYGTILFCVQFVVPFSIIFFCYSSILHTVRQVNCFFFFLVVSSFALLFCFFLIWISFFYLKICRTLAPESVKRKKKKTPTNYKSQAN